MAPGKPSTRYKSRVRILTHDKSGGAQRLMRFLCGGCTPRTRLYNAYNGRRVVVKKAKKCEGVTRFSGEIFSILVPFGVLGWRVVLHCAHSRLRGWVCDVSTCPQDGANGGVAECW